MKGSVWELFRISIAFDFRSFDCCYAPSVLITHGLRISTRIYSDSLEIESSFDVGDADLRPLPGS